MGLFNTPVSISVIKQKKFSGYMMMHLMESNFSRREGPICYFCAVLCTITPRFIWDFSTMGYWWKHQMHTNAALGLIQCSRTTLSVGLCFS